MRIQWGLPPGERHAMPVCESTPSTACAQLDWLPAARSSLCRGPSKRKRPRLRPAYSTLGQPNFARPPMQTRARRPSCASGCAHVATFIHIPRRALAPRRLSKLSGPTDRPDLSFLHTRRPPPPPSQRPIRRPTGTPTEANSGSVSTPACAHTANQGSRQTV